MKKVFPLFALFLFLSMSLAFAVPEPPYMFNVILTKQGIPLNSAKVTIDNLDDGIDATQTLTTESNGRVIFPLCSAGCILDYISVRGVGDRMQVTACTPESNDNCVATYKKGIDCTSDVDCVVKIDLAEDAEVVYVEKEPIKEEKEITIIKTIVEGTDEWWNAILGGLIVLAASILEVRYKWGKSFIALVRYWAIKKKDPKRAVKMLQTALGKEKANKYIGK